MKRIKAFIMSENGQMMVQTGAAIGFVAMTIVVTLFVVTGGVVAREMLL